MPVSRRRRKISRYGRNVLAIAALSARCWDLYERNLLSEYHIRYGGFGGIGYHVSDLYIALFSHFIPCGAYEGAYILDPFYQNKSDIQPDTVHADTHGQSAPIFGLAYVLGIQLMPRICNWKNPILYRPSKEVRYEHIDTLFSASVDWELIATHLPDMLRVGISIAAASPRRRSSASWAHTVGRIVCTKPSDS
jgi:TnpA family transposase